MYKLGKLPAREDAITFKLKNYASVLPVAPKKYGHQILIDDWGMFANDIYGDCVWAGAGHETMLWNKEASKNVSLTDDNILNAYSATTGFTKDDPSTDNGTDMQVAASYRRKTGIVDANGVVHKVGAYLALDKANVPQIKQALYLFGAVGIGIQFPASAMEQFNKHSTWTVIKNSSVEGGHYIPVVGYDSRYVYLVTWGKLQKATWGFIKKYMDEGVVYLSSEFLTNGKSLEGFDLITLTSNLKSL